MKNTYGYLLLIIIILIILFKVNFTTSINTKESFDMNQMTYESDYTNIDPYALNVDVTYMTAKSKTLDDLIKKLTKLRSFLYDQPLDKVIQLKAVEKKDGMFKNNNKFEVKHKSSGNFNNVYTIEVPIGDQGPRGEPGDQGPRGDRGVQGDQGPIGNCGLCIK